MPFLSFLFKWNVEILAFEKKKTNHIGELPVSSVWAVYCMFRKENKRQKPAVSEWRRSAQGSRRTCLATTKSGTNALLVSWWPRCWGRAGAAGPERGGRPDPRRTEHREQLGTFGSLTQEKWLLGKSQLLLISSNELWVRTVHFNVRRIFTITTTLKEIEGNAP